MSIASAIQNAQEKVENAYAAVSNKGGTLPATQDLSNLPTAIGSITVGKTSVTFGKSSSNVVAVSLSNSSSQSLSDMLNHSQDYTGDLNSTYYVCYRTSLGSDFSPVFSITFS